MSKDLRGTKIEAEILASLADMSNPTAYLFSDLFARHKDRPPKCMVSDIIEIGPENYAGVKPKTVTTVGIYLFNKFILEDFKVFGYLNRTLDKDTWSSMEDRIAEALQAGDITQRQVCEYIDRTQYLLGGPLAQIINPSISPAILRLPPAAKKVKKEMLANHKEELDRQDAQAAVNIEREVTKVALEEMRKKATPEDMSIFDSGAVDPYNNYKTMFVMKGAVTDNTGESPTGYKIITSNYDEGVTKQDMPLIADTVVTSSYSSGVSTQDSGTLGKKYNALLQNVSLQGPGTDCKTPDTMKTIITKRHLYRNIMVSGKPLTLTPENIDKYRGKVCDLRTPIHCHAPEPYYCSVCTGERLQRVGVNNVGLTFGIISGSTLNAALKVKHDARVKQYHVTVSDLMKYVK